MTTSRESKHFLVVNDTEEIVELFRDILEAMGHRCSAMSYAPDDLAEVTKAKPDLVILDLLLGGEKLGWQLAQKMRMSRETERTPIIICTAATEDVREHEASWPPTRSRSFSNPSRSTISSGQWTRRSNSQT